MDEMGDVDVDQYATDETVDVDVDVEQLCSAEETDDVYDEQMSNWKEDKSCRWLEEM
jgi:hypothetical protein